MDVTGAWICFQSGAESLCGSALFIRAKQVLNQKTQLSEQKKQAHGTWSICFQGYQISQQTHPFVYHMIFWHQEYSALTSSGFPMSRELQRWPRRNYTAHVQKCALSLRNEENIKTQTGSAITSWSSKRERRGNNQAWQIFTISQNRFPVKFMEYVSLTWMVRKVSFKCIQLKGGLRFHISLLIFANHFLLTSATLNKLSQKVWFNPSESHTDSYLIGSTPTMGSGVESNCCSLLA